MVLSGEVGKLYNFIKIKHANQVRKYTGEPYYLHPLEVSNIVSRFDVLAFPVALCHDVLEDFEYTNCTEEELKEQLLICGYPDNEANLIIEQVKELTNQFTSKTHPHLNRAERKKLECERLATISSTAQTVKYADISHNAFTIMQHDPKFAKVYLKEKLAAVNVMQAGHPQLRYICLKQLQDSIQKLNKNE